jgi:hypothetical protein
MATPRSNAYSVASGGGVYAGRPAAPTPNVWRQLTVAPHSRKVIRVGAPPDSGTYTTLAAGAQAYVEGLELETVQAIPACGYNILVHDGAGTFYYTGTLHSGYQGCEINIIRVPLDDGSVVEVELSHQPTSPPQGPNSGYAAGLGGSIYKQSYAAEGVVGFDDQTAAIGWKPFIGHDWSFSTHTPTTGFATMVAHPVQIGQAPGQPYHTGTFVMLEGLLRGVTLSTAEQTLSNFTAVTNGSFVYARNGGAPTTVTGINLSGATSLASVAAIITSALSGAVMSWDSGSSRRFTLSSATTGASSSISVLTSAGTGTDLGPLLKMQASDGAVSWPGGGIKSSHSNPSDDYTSGSRQIGLVGFDRATGRFKTWLSQLSPEITSLPGSGWPFTSNAYGLGRSGISDFNPLDGSILLFNSIGGGVMNCIHYVPATHTVRLVASIESSGATASLSGMGGGPGNSENGWLIRHLEGYEYLMLRQNLTGRAGIGLFKFSETYGIGDARRIDLTGSLPSGAAGEPFAGVGSASDPLSFCVDKVGRRVFWLVAVPGSAPRFYVSSFDSLMSWSPAVTTGLANWADAAVWHTLDRQPMHYFNGRLYLHDNAPGLNNPGWLLGAMNIKDCYVGT